MIQFAHIPRYLGCRLIINKKKQCLLQKYLGTDCHRKYWYTTSSVLKTGEHFPEIEEIKHVFDLRDPAHFFLKARSMKRHVIFHAGPTNSGKTHQAIQSFLKASSGIYCGPLRMLAAEIYRKANEQNVLCDMITGEERLWATDENTPAEHVSCTVEMCSTTNEYEVAVIDEVQMLRCVDRGWAWSRALLGVPANEIHVCGEPSALKIVKKLLSSTHDTFEVKSYERLSPLHVLNKSLCGWQNLRKGDCIIAFSQRDIYKLRTIVERQTKLKCAVIYGNLPSNIRLQQADQFNNGICDVVIASDAIGMGMNLNIQRIIFSKLRKFDGISISPLTSHHTKQIAGRAGRYGSTFDVGYVTGIHNSQMGKLKSLMKQTIWSVKRAGILPSFAQLELLSVAMPGKNLLHLMETFEHMMLLDENYFLCDVSRFKMVASIIEDIPLTLSQSYMFAIAPVNITKSQFVCSSMTKFAKFVSNDRQVPKELVEKIILWPLKQTPRSISALQHLEYVHEVLDLYRWLSYRFPEIFIDLNGVIELQEELEDIISRAVDSNLKYYKKENKLNAILRRRKKNKKHL